MSKTKFFGLIVVVSGILLATASIQAATDTEVLQPAAPGEAIKIGDLGSYFDEYSTYMQLSTALHSDQTSWWPDIHIGGQGVGGVTFFNGTIVNSTTNPETGADQPVTFGDKVRIDDYIYRNAPGTADKMPVLIGDGLSPALDDINALGEADRRWQYLYVSDNIYGENIIHEDNLSVTNDSTANYYLGSAGNNEFTWLKVSDHDSLSELESTVEDGEMVVRDGDSWTTRNVTEAITENITNKGDTIEEGDVLIREGDTWVAGDISEIVETFPDGENHGDVLYYNGTDWVTLEPGIDGTFLQTQGIGDTPIWTGVSGSIGNGTVDNSTLRWDNAGSAWTENTSLLATSTGAITRGIWQGTAIDISDHTNLTVGDHIALTDDDHLDIDDDFLLNTGDTGTGNYDFTGAVLQGASALVFEGNVADTFETTFAITNPTTTDRTVTFPNASGEVSLLGQAIDLTSEVTGILPLANGGTGANLANPAEADRIMFWDNSANTVAWLTAGTNLTISDTLIEATDTNTQNTLDQAYDEGDAGAGRAITADNGAVSISGAPAGTVALEVADGDLTVDATTLVVKSDKDRIGIGTTAPNSMFHVTDDGTDETVPNDNYAQLGRYGTTPPNTTDCATNADIGRIYIDITGIQGKVDFYVCAGATNGWNAVGLN